MSRKPQEMPEKKAERMLSSYDIDVIFPGTSAAPLKPALFYS